MDFLNRNGGNMAIINLIEEIKGKIKPLIFRDQLSSIKLESGDVAIDCGANIGMVTKRMAKRGVEVYAFEPNPHAFEVLKNRFKNNSSVTCINKGVHNKKGNFKLFMHENAEDNPVLWSVGSSMIEDKGNVSNSNYVLAEVVDLIEFIEKIGKRIKVLKMDVEGVEYDILNTLIDSGIIRNIDNILVEAHEDKIPSLMDDALSVRSKIKNQNIQNIDLTWT